MSAIYVDDLRPCLRSKTWPWLKSCHLFVDPKTPLASLHTMAAQIGLRWSWFQAGRFPHYDLNATRREAAIKAGAIELDRRAAVEIMRVWNRIRRKRRRA